MLHRTLLSRIVQAIAEARRAPTLEDKLRFKRNVAYAVHLCTEAVDNLHAMAGARGIYDHYPIQRLFRDAHALMGHIGFSWDAQATPWGLVALGGDFDYGRLDATAHRYWPLFDDRLILGAGVEYQQSGDNSPFYALPWIRLRGIPAYRNLGNYTVTGEIEPRWKIDGRWSLLAFGGAGRAARELDRLDDAERAYSFGAGFRYLLARKLGLAAGLDVARGPEDTVTYIIFGSAWGM